MQALLPVDRVAPGILHVITTDDMICDSAEICSCKFKDTLQHLQAKPVPVNTK